jgi:ligand-binding sensor domain-containing protein
MIVKGSEQRTDPNYLIDSWETEDGLPEDSATAIVQTPDGYIWLGTFDGLVRFNGVEFTSNFGSIGGPLAPCSEGREVKETSVGPCESALVPLEP